MLLLTVLMFCIQECNAQLCDWQWARVTGGNGIQEGTAVASDKSGNVYVSGYFFLGTNTPIRITSGASTFFNTNNYQSKFFFAKYSSTGNPLWAKSSNMGTSYAASIATDGDANVYLAGAFVDSISFDSTHLLTRLKKQTSFIVKYDSSGNVLWTRTPTAGYQNNISGISTDNSGNVYVTGYFDSLPIIFGSDTLYSSGLSNTSFFVVKYDPLGNVVWAKGPNNPLSSNSIVTSISVDHKIT